VIELQPLYLRHHRLHSGAQRITVRVAQKPGTVSVDPFDLMIDRMRDNNGLRLEGGTGLAGRNPAKAPKWG
jgi:hypothetical protein